MIFINVDHWLQQVLSVRQSLPVYGLWQQDAFMLLMCVTACMMLFFTGTVICLFMQSLWGIFIAGHHPVDEEYR